MGFTITVKVSMAFEAEADMVKTISFIFHVIDFISLFQQ